MAAVTFSTTPTTHCSSSSYSFRLIPTYSPKHTPHLSFYSHFNRSSTFPLISLKSNTTTTKKSSLRAFTVVSALKKLSETDLIAVPEGLEEFTSKFPSDTGVYAVHDQNDDLQFIGISRNIAASVLSHRKSVPQLCCSVKVGVVDEPDRTSLTQAWKSWMEEHIAATGKIPPGNESGNTTWVKKPQKKPDLRLTPGRHVQLTIPLEELIDQLVKENKVVAFIKGSRSAPLCGFSQRVVGILEGEGVDFESVDVLDDEHNFGLREKLKSYSNWPTFPQIFVNGELIGGCDILTSMQEKGELASLLKNDLEGYSRQINLRLGRSNIRLKMAHVVGVVDEPDRTSLTQAWKSWMEEHIAATGKIPPGNESGNTTWVKKPQKKPDLRLTPGRHVQLTIPLEELIDQLVKENKVVAFIKGSRSAPLCGFSQRVVGILEGEGVDFESVDVLDDEHNFGLREKLKSYSNWPTFPQIFVNGELIGGCDILTSMQEKGELASLLKK
ncbi:Glutaredoxin [Macleaya cordata]|uniref:Glutaredoxin n=1 Tax=Macleaya cordata TaxID=56857 RepID=A0A200PX02_MACCD|nr:Glutaredoxin [Macleaya cordata]